MLVRPSQIIGTYAVVAAIGVILLAPLLAIAYFATADGAEYLEAATVAAWAEPARDLAGPLVTFAGADRVYATYTQVLAVLYPAVVLTAVATRSQRPVPRPRSERSGWVITLVGYGLFGAGLVVVALLLVGGDTTAPAANAAFLGAMLPGLLLSLIGSTMLGVRFLRSGYQPRLTAWLLTLAIPLWVVGSFLLGHNGIGIIPLFVAWAATGARWRQTAAPPHAAPSPSGTRG